MAWNVQFTNAKGARTFTPVKRTNLQGRLRIPKEEVPHRHGQYVGDEVTIDSPQEHLEGQLVYATLASAQTDVDDFTTVLHEATRGKLYYSADRYLNCWAESFDFRPMDGTALLRWEYEIDFWGDDPFWYAASASQQVENKTAQPWNFTATTTGKAAVYPTWTVLANGGVDITSVIVTNNTTLKSFTYTGTIVAGNSWVFDAANFTSKNNGVCDLANLSSGSIPVWLNAGANSMTLSTNANCRLTIDWRERFFSPSFT